VLAGHAIAGAEGLRELLDDPAGPAGHLRDPRHRAGPLSVVDAETGVDIGKLVAGAAGKRTAELNPADRRIGLRGIEQQAEQLAVQVQPDRQTG